jgi:hypothetical protein
LVVGHNVQLYLPRLPPETTLTIRDSEQADESNAQWQACLKLSLIKTLMPE